MLELQHITLSRNGVNLIENADARIHPGQRVGLTGRNGSGKSTLLALLRHDLEPDSGNYRLPPDWRIASVAQETPSLPDSALDELDDEAIERSIAEINEAIQRTSLKKH